MKKNNKFLLVIISIFVLLVSVTTFISFSSNIEAQEVIVKSITPVYDESSTVLVDSNNVVFNDKNQIVEYKVVIENTQNYDVKITDITLSTPTEEFLQYTLKDISKDDVLAANSTKELIISLETMGIEGWGRNFNDELTANVSFERVRKNEPVDPPKEEDNKEEVETPKEEIKQPEPPAPTIKEVIKQTEKIEPTKVTKDVIEFKDDVKVEIGDKVAVWIYSEPIFLGYFDVVVTNGVKQIVGLEEALKKADIEVGEHNIVLETEDKEVLGYVEIYINEDKDLLSEKPQDTTDKEENKPSVNKPSEDKQEEQKEDEDGKIENPYTSDKGLLVVLVIATGVTGLALIVVSKNKFAKYIIFIIALSSTLTLVNADELSDLPITINANFKSQNVMKPSGLAYDAYDYYYIDGLYGVDYWAYATQIKNFYIQNEITEIDEYAFKFDVTEDNNGRVMAYLVERDDGLACYNFDEEEDICYDLYLQADGVIYPNEDSSYYFAAMRELDNIDNLVGIDTSEVTNMRGMFSGTGENSETFILDLSNFDTSNVMDMSSMFEYVADSSSFFTLDLSTFDTSNVTNMSQMFEGTGQSIENFVLNLGENFATSKVADMSSMFAYTGYYSESFVLDVSNFDTRNVTDMSYMFCGTGYNSRNLTLDVSNFDTSKVINMAGTFSETGYNSENFTLDLSNFDTSNVTDMSYMFGSTGYNSRNLTLDVSNFDTSNVTDMSDMFGSTGYNSRNLTLDVSNFDTSNVTDMSYMFYYTGYYSEKFTLDVSNFDTSKVTDMSYMFSGAGFNSENFTLDVSNFDTSNVTSMNSMFNNTGYYSEKFTLDVSNFDTSKVTDMRYMFCGTGYNSTRLNTSITIKNSKVNNYSQMFQSTALKQGTQIKVNYTNETEKLVANMIATKSGESNVVKGNCIDCGEDYIPIGTEIDINGEKFNVISQTNDTVTMLAQYNLSPDYKQSTIINYVKFADTTGWEYTPGPKEIDIQEWSTNPKTYVNAYVEYLKTELGADSVTGDLITLKELESLGCKAPSDYGSTISSYRTCANSPYKSWLINGKKWWTRSASSGYANVVWHSNDDETLYYSYTTSIGGYGIRPVITISKEALRNLQ